MTLGLSLSDSSPILGHSGVRKDFPSGERAFKDEARLKALAFLSQVPPQRCRARKPLT
jgi:hypothetical protein